MDKYKKICEEHGVCSNEIVCIKYLFSPRPTKLSPLFVILSYLTPDDFTRHGRTSRWESVNWALSAHLSFLTLSIPDRPKPPPLLFYLLRESLYRWERVNLSLSSVIWFPAPCISLIKHFITSLLSGHFS